MSLKIPRPLSATLISDFSQCPRKAWLRMHEDPAKRREDSDLSKIVFEAGNQYENTLIERWGAYQVGGEGFVQREEYTKKAISESHPVIHHAVLSHTIGSQKILCEFDFLVLNKSKSGSAFYQIVEVKHSRQSKSYQHIQLAVNSFILEQHQGVQNEHYFYLGKDHIESWNFEDYRHLIGVYINDCLELLKSPLADKQVYRSLCTFCAWKDYCYKDWESRDYPAILPEVMLSDLPHMKNAGISSIHSIQTTKTPEGLPSGLRKRWPLIKKEAEAIVSGTMTRKKKETYKLPEFLIHLEKDFIEEKAVVAAMISTKEGEVFFSGLGREAEILEFLEAHAFYMQPEMSLALQRWQWQWLLNNYYLQNRSARAESLQHFSYMEKICGEYLAVKKPCLNLDEWINALTGENAVLHEAWMQSLGHKDEEAYLASWEKLWSQLWKALKVVRGEE